MEWRKVNRRNFRHIGSKRWDIYSEDYGYEAGKEEVISIYFSEIPEWVKAEDIFKRFGEHGRVVEVVIPPKRNKFGKRFGFTRFSGVEEGRVLAVKLDNIFFDKVKIHANIPRFSKTGFDDRRGDRGKRVVPINKGINVPGKKNYSGNEGGRKDGRSFAEVVNDGGVRRPFGTNKMQSRLNFLPSEEETARFRKAYIGVISELGMSYNIQTTFELEGYFSIKVTPLGVNLCLLEEREEGEIRDLISEAELCWKQWFVEVRRWEEADVDKERVTWLRCYGIPCHSWNYKFFELLANTVGKLICVDENTSKGDCLDVARIMVRTRFAVVLNEVFNVMINKDLFSIKVTEDVHGPLRILLWKWSILNDILSWKWSILNDISHSNSDYLAFCMNPIGD